MDEVMIVNIDDITYYQPRPEEYDMPVEVINNRLAKEGYELDCYDPQKRLWLLSKI